MATRLNREQNILDTLRKVRDGAAQAFGEGREDHRQALQRARGEKGEEIEGTKLEQMMGSNRSVTLMRELLGMADKEDIAAREAMGLGLKEDRAERVGQVLGTLAGDIVQDRGRSLWWLLNAPQAVGQVVGEGVTKRMAPDLYKADKLTDEKDNFVSTPRTARRLGYIDAKGNTAAGVSRDKDGIYQKRKYDPGFIDALNVPTGLAINSSIGLMNPFGGAEGYKAVFEDEEDPSKTSNVIAEIGAKYILGKTGNLLNWEDFKKVRPDVSKDEYQRYKAFKFDKGIDLNPLDGDLNVGGVLKYTDEGIHGPEVQFLGRSLPIATGILPTAAAIVGTGYGAQRGLARGRGVRGGLIGGTAALAGASALGNVIEGERRRRNQAENERDTNNIDTISL